MKTKYIIILLSVISFFSCEKKEHTEKTPEEIVNETPEALDENTSDYKLSSKRYDSDIISKLYMEALEKNEKLKLLDENISNINNDSLDDHTEAYLKYTNTNNNYWASANQYIGYLNDSILREETLAVFKNLEDNYKERIALHDQKFEEIQDRTSTVNERLVLMKLMISASMMKNYQTNEQPNINELEKLLMQYDTLIKETEEFTKIGK